MNDTSINNLDAILYRLNELEQKTKEMDRLRTEISELKNLTVIGSEVASEVEKQVLADVEELKQKDIHIPYLQKKADKILFKRRNRKKRGENHLLESDILEAQKVTFSASEAAHKLGVSNPTYKKYCLMYGIYKTRRPSEKRTAQCPHDPNRGKYPLSKILNNECVGFPIHRLKDKLIRAGLKKPECEQCGFKERRITDGKLPLLLNFDDGDKNNHKLENLQVYCYNCTFVSGRGYIKRGTVGFNMDPDIMQGANYLLKPRF